MNIPEDLNYTEEHEWVRFNDGNAIVGITDFAQSQLGDIIFLELPDVQDKIIAGESFGEIEAVKTVSELYAPINGTVIEVNNDLEDFPEKVNKDCYRDGWIIKVKPEDETEKKDLLDHNQYRNIIE
ncbi:MAG: glycine cleavage system protein H [Cytophagia bacterium]|nr:glycine cleavage system protein H [Cytophagia bacterium]